VHALGGFGKVKGVAVRVVAGPNKYFTRVFKRVLGTAFAMLI